MGITHTFYCENRHNLRLMLVYNIYNLEQKKTTFFNADLVAFSLGKTKKLNDQMKALEKILKSRPIPLF